MKSDIRLTTKNDGLEDFVFDLQRHAEEDPKTEVEYFEFVDPQNGKKIELPKTLGDEGDGVNLQELIGHVIGKSRADAKKEADQRNNTLLEELEKLRGANSELDAKLQQIDDDIAAEKMSAVELAQRDAQKKIDKAQRERDETKVMADAFWNMYEENKIENDIFGAFSGYDLCNPKQTMALIKNDLKARVQDENGKIITVLTFVNDGDEETLDPKTGVSKWLALEENSHHLKNNLRSGGGSSETGGRASEDGTIQYTREQMADPKIRHEYTKKLYNGESVQIVER